MSGVYENYCLSGREDLVPALKDSQPFLVGAAVAPWQLRADVLGDLCARHFSSLTCENAMKPESVLDREATLAYGGENRACISLKAGESVARFAMAHGITMRFHVLVWHQQTPRWFFAKGWDNGPDAPLVDADTLLARMDNYIHDVMDAVNAAWPGLISAWDVVNEAVEPDHGHPLLLRTKNSLYYQIIGEGYIRSAFEMARKYAQPGQKLFYNDFNSFQPEKQEAILRFLQPLVEDGLADGMGMQTHLMMDYPVDMATYEAALRKYAALGITIHATEIDIRCHDGTPAGEAALAERYRQLFDIFRRVKAEGIDLESVTLWGMTDDFSWINRPDRPSWPLLFGHRGALKPAYFGALGDTDACRPVLTDKDVLTADTDTASVVLDWRCDAPATVELADADSGETLAAIAVPAAGTWRRQLFLLGTLIPAGTRMRVKAEGAWVRGCELHAPAETSVGANPLIGADFPDPDVIRVGDTYYMVSTTMHFMPGAALLKSYDLIHWELAGHIYDALPATERRCLQNGQNAYAQGMWAPCLKYHDGTFYVTFSCNDTHCSYLYTAQRFEGPWTLREMDGFYYDSSLFFDDDGRVYIVHGNRRPRITELESDCLRKKEGGLDRQLLDYGDSPMLGYEGLHLYKIGGRYQLFTIHSNRERWFREESVFSADRLTDAFTGGVIVHDDANREGFGVAQGGCVDTPDGRWFCFLFQDRGAVGRIPMLLPMHWEHGEPVVERVPGTVVNLTTRPAYVCPPIGSDDLTAPCWEWNHIPRPEHAQRTADTLRVTTAQVTAALTDAPNMLTRRTEEPGCVMDVTVDGSALLRGDMAGLCALQGQWAFIGLEKTRDGNRLVAITRTEGDAKEGAVRAEIPWANDTARLRLTFDFKNMADTVSLWYHDGDKWACLHKEHPMRFTLDMFTGYRATLAVCATEKAGGAAVFSDVHMEKTAQ